MSRVDIVDRELLQIMKRAGCDLIIYGVESGSDRVLKLIGKDINRDTIIRAFELTRKTGIKVASSFMIGLPYETRDDINMTSMLIKQINPDILDLSVFQPYPGSRFFYDSINNKIGVRIKTINWRFFHRNTGRNLIYENFEEDEVDRIKWKILLKFYSKPSKIISSWRFVYGIYKFLPGYIMNIFYWKIYRRMKKFRM